MMNKNNQAIVMEQAGRRGEPVVEACGGSKPLTPPASGSSSHVVDDVIEWVDHNTKLISSHIQSEDSSRSINGSDLEQGGIVQRVVRNDDDDGDYSESDTDDEAQDDVGSDAKKPVLRTLDYKSSFSSLSTATSRRSAEPPGQYLGTTMMHQEQQPQQAQQRPMMLTNLTTAGPSTSSGAESSSSGRGRGNSLARDASGIVMHANTPTTARRADDNDDDDEIIKQIVNGKRDSGRLENTPAPQPPAFSYITPEWISNRITRRESKAQAAPTLIEDDEITEHVVVEAPAPDNIRADPTGGADSKTDSYEEEEDGEKIIKAMLDSPDTTTGRASSMAATTSTTTSTTTSAAAASNRQQQQPGAYRVPSRQAVDGSSIPTTELVHVDEPVTAVLVSSDDDDRHHGHIPVDAVAVHADPTRNNKGSTPPSRCSNSRIRIVGIVLLVLLSLVVIGLVVAFFAGQQSPDVEITAAPTPTPAVDPDDLWYNVMDPIDGSPDSEFGSSVSMCSDGSRVAIGAQGSGFVQVYELDNQIQGGRKQIGQTIIQNVTGDVSVPFIRSQVVVELARNCKVLAIGYPFANVGDKNMAGQVALYEYNSSANSWLPLGDPNIITGEDASDFAGASLSLSQTGDRVAIGSPGNDWSGEDAGRARVFQVNQGGWELLGTAINGTSAGEEFGGSISLTSDDASDTYILAVGSSSLRTMPSDEYVFTLSAEVARVYELQTGTWSQRGQGIVPNVLGIDTAWFVKLSSDGKKLVVSNLYLDPEGVRVTDGEVNSGIYVSAFELDMMGNWTPRGGNIHANFPGKKSGYIISLSDDGSRIGMGDPGRDEGGGLAGHSHFYEFIDDQWCQLGPNIHGESAGDMAGYSVSLSGDGKRMAVASPRSRAQGLEHGRVNVVELHEELIVPNCEGISF